MFQKKKLNALSKSNMTKQNINRVLVLFFLSIAYFGFTQQVVKPSEAIALALENNYGIKIANNNLEVAENNKSVLNSGYLPTLTGNAGATYNLDNTEAQFSNGESTTLNGAESSRYNASINLNYTLQY